MADLPEQLHVLFHTPGPRWQPGVAARDQDGIELHYAFGRRLLAEGVLVSGGPFVDAENGGMMVVRTATIEDAERLADEDESVRSGLFAVHVRPWRVVMRGDG